MSAPSIGSGGPPHVGRHYMSTSIAHPRDTVFHGCAPPREGAGRRTVLRCSGDLSERALCTDLGSPRALPRDPSPRARPSGSVTTCVLLAELAPSVPSWLLVMLPGVTTDSGVPGCCGVMRSATGKRLLPPLESTSRKTDWVPRWSRSPARPESPSALFTGTSPSVRNQPSPSLRTSCALSSKRANGTAWTMCWRALPLPGDPLRSPG